MGQILGNPVTSGYLADGVVGGVEGGKVYASLSLVGFYNNLKTQQAAEGRGGNTTRSYGTASSSVDINIELTTMSFTQKANGIVWERRDHTFTYSNVDRILVGWKIQDNWGTGPMARGPHTRARHWRKQVAA